MSDTAATVVDRQPTSIDKSTKNESSNNTDVANNDQQQPRRRRLQKVTDKFSSWRNSRRKSDESIAIAAADMSPRDDHNRDEHSADFVAAVSGLEDAVSIKTPLADLNDILDQTPNYNSVLYKPGGGSYNEHIINAAKDLGRDLFSDLSLQVRRKKIDEQVVLYHQLCPLLLQIDRIQEQINETTNERLAVMKLAKVASTVATTSDAKSELSDEFNRLDDRLQALAVLMLHYCAGLQNCIDLEEEDVTIDESTIVDEVTITPTVTVENDIVIETTTDTHQGE